MDGLYICENLPFEITNLLQRSPPDVKYTRVSIGFTYHSPLYAVSAIHCASSDPTTLRCAFQITYYSPRIALVSPLTPGTSCEPSRRAVRRQKDLPWDRSFC